MVISLDQRVQRAHWFAIVDEVDSVLIDEARTPLIISGPVGNENDAMFAEHNAAVERLFRRQTELANALVAEGERALEAGDEAAAGAGSYKAQLGRPKNKRLLKACRSPGVKQLVQNGWSSTISPTASCRPAKQQYQRPGERPVLRPRREGPHGAPDRPAASTPCRRPTTTSSRCPTSRTEMHRIDHDPDMSPQEKIEARRAIEAEYALKSEKLHIVHQLLRAHALYEKDVNYVVQDGEVLIVDEFTGRTMPGRRWSEGLHQAVEAKEGVQVKGETQTLATITIQNYFRMYDKLAGMTGHRRDGGDGVPPDLQARRGRHPHQQARHPRGPPRPRLQDPAREVQRHRRGDAPPARARLSRSSSARVSVEVSETLSRMFKRARPHAQRPQREVPPARGRDRRRSPASPGPSRSPRTWPAAAPTSNSAPGVTSAKPSQVKDPDGKPIDVTECGGLHIVGSERHESRRIDRQLRGRAGRQGDPGASQFFLSLEDDLMRLFGSERIARLMDRLGAQEGEVLTHPLITRSIEQAQKRVELQNFQARKRLLEYDDVMNQQREVIYSLRAFALEGGEELRGEALKMVEKAAAQAGRTTCWPSTRTPRSGTLGCCARTS